MADGSAISGRDGAQRCANAPRLSRRVPVASNTQRVDRVWLGAGGLSLAFLALVVLYPLGVGGDYPDHLARSFIIGWIGDVETLSQFYRVEADLVPRLAMDAIVPWASRITGIYTAGAAFVFAAMVAAPLAGVVMSRRLHGAAGGWLPLIGFASVFSLGLEFGFVDFMFAIGGSILLFALWVNTSYRPRALVFFALAFFALAVAHALAFLFLGFLVGVWELANLATGRRGSIVAFVRHGVIRVAPVFVPGLVLIGASMLQASGLNSVDVPVSIIHQRDLALMSPFRFHGGADAVIAAFTSFGVLALGISLGLKFGVLRMERELAIVCVATFALVALMPTGVTGVWGLHLRFGPALVVLLAASFRFADDLSDAPKNATAAAFGVFVLVLMLQFMNAAPHFARIDDGLSRIRAAVADLPAGSTLLKAAEEGANLRIAHHGGSLAVIEAGAFKPTIFTQTSLVEVTEDKKSMHLPFGEPLTLDELAEGAERAPTLEHNGYWSKTYFHGWPQRFSHLIVGHDNAGESIWEAPSVIADYLCPIHQDPVFTLFEVKAADTSCVGGAVPHPQAAEVH